MQIREERPEDREGIRTVTDAAFGRPDESALIERLRDDDLVITSLVADEYGEIVGHILFSELEIASNDYKTTLRGASLAPMAVAPTHQRMGIGSELVRQGIETCQEKGVDAIAVVGHERFYPRFGFSAEIGECLESPFSPPFFMIFPIKRGIFDGFSGIVTYPPAFDLDSQK